MIFHQASTNTMIFHQSSFHRHYNFSSFQLPFTQGLVSSIQVSFRQELSSSVHLLFTQRIIFICPTLNYAKVLFINPNSIYVRMPFTNTSTTIRPLDKHLINYSNEQLYSLLYKQIFKQSDSYGKLKLEL